MADEHLNELARQCANATQFSRLNGTEQIEVLSWLINGGHMTRTGNPLEKPLPAPQPIANNPDGSPIYEPGTDFSKTRTVTMR